ncbi:hypothetical protein [Catenuloplanes japonicus]|uniref:hypothetical protein n=1 Tax=Catenuloplanes japonicus TaxID=33876 RepID=UPI000526822A|nr:hypothetical protein [Catenuloplanes japonicus]
MAIDFTYANSKAVEYLKPLDDYSTEHGHEAGWAWEVVETIQDSDELVDDQDLTDEERAAYDYYTTEITPKEKWDAIVADNKDKIDNYEKPSDDSVEFEEEPEEGVSYSSELSEDFEAPEGVHEYAGGDNNANKSVAVSHEAIEHFCRQLDAIAPEGGGILLTARTAVNAIDLKPGRFAKAELLRRSITGTDESNPGLRGDTAGALRAAHEALFDLRVSLRQMMTDYETADEFNKMTAEQLGDAMEDPWGSINRLSEYGTASSGEGSTDSDSGDSGSGSDSDSDSGSGSGSDSGSDSGSSDDED